VPLLGYDECVARLTRREFAEAVLGVLGPVALLRELRAREALAAPVRIAAGDLLARVDEASRALASGASRPAEWQARVEELASRADLDDLRRAVDLDRLSRTRPSPATGRGASTCGWAPSASAPRCSDSRAGPPSLRTATATWRRCTW
jgi:hypothetical protein